MSSPSANNQWLKNAVLITGGAAVVGTAAYLTYRHWNSLQGTDDVAASDSAKKSPATLLKEKGNKLFQQKKYPEAIDVFQQALMKLNPSEPGYRELASICSQNTAACYDALQKSHECIIHCTKALEHNPRYLKAYVRRGTAHSTLNQYEEALRDFTAVSLIDPRNPLMNKIIPSLEKLHAELVKKRIEQIQVERLAGINFPIPETAVIEWLRHSVVRDPIVERVKTLSSRDPKDELEKVLYLIKNHEYGRVADAATALFVNEQSPYRLEGAAIAARFYRFHNNLQACKAAIVGFFELLSRLTNEDNPIAPYTDLVLSVHSISATISPTLTAAEEIVREAEVLDATNVDVRFGYALNAVLHKQLDTAAQAMEAIIGIAPDHPYARFYTAHFDFVRACEEQHLANIHNHIVQMEQLMHSHDVAPVFTYTVMANIHSSSGNYPLALEIINKGLEVYPGLVEFIMLKAITESKAHNAQEQNIESLSQVFIDLCKRDPNNFEAQATYAKICGGKKLYDKAIEGFERAIQLARMPQELSLAVGELILTQAAREASFLIDKAADDSGTPIGPSGDTTATPATA